MLVSALLAAAASAARAEDDGAAAPPQPLPEVLVEASPVETPAAPLADVTASATVIDTSDAPTRVQTLTEVLSQAPGVQVRRFGGLGEFSTVSVRGFSPGQVRVYLDGVPLGRADDETVNLGDLPIDAVERVEVYRGTTPLAFPESGPGGVVNVVSRRPGATPLTAASASYGSFDTRKVDLARGATHGDLDTLVFASYFGSKNDFTYLDDRGTDANPDDDVTVRRRNAAFDQGDLLARLGWRATPALRLALTSDTFLKSQGVPGRGSVQSPDAHRDVARQLAQVDAGWTPPGGLPLDVDAGAWTLWQRQTFTSPVGDPAFGASDSVDRSLAGGGQVVVRAALGAHHVPGLLAALSQDALRTSQAYARVPGSGPTRTRLHLTFGAEDEIVVFDERVSLVPGVRWELFHDDFPLDPGVPPPLRSGGTSSRDFVSPRLGARARPLDWLTLRGNLGRWTREPNLLELFGNSGTVQGNPDLQAETSVNWDAGFRLDLPPLASGLLAEAALEYAFFHARIDDVIVLVPSSVNVFRPQNVSSARIAGSEVALHARLADRVGGTLNYTYQDTLTHSSNPQSDDKELPGRPADELHARLEFDWSPARPLPGLPRLWPGRVWYELDLIAGNWLDTANTQRVGSRALHGVGVELALPWLEGLRVALEVDNLTDDQTQDVLDFPLPGRSVFATVSWGFAPPGVPNAAGGG